MLIRAICLNYSERPAHEKEKIQRLCISCGGAHSAALFEAMTSEKSIKCIAQKYYISDSLLYTLRVVFYESWDDNRKDNKNG